MLEQLGHRLHKWLESQTTAYFRRRMTLGRNVQLRPGLSVYKPHNVTIGDTVSININCVLQAHAPITIGDFSLLGPGCMIVTANHDVAKRDLAAFGEIIKSPVTIGRNCWLGAGVIVLPGVTIGDDSVVGAGSVVTTDLPPGKICLGAPARPVRDRPFSDEPGGPDSGRTG